MVNITERKERERRTRVAFYLCPGPLNPSEIDQTHSITVRHWVDRDPPDSVYCRKHCRFASFTNMKVIVNNR